MDLISRKAAIEALGEFPENWTDSPEEIEAVNSWLYAANAINSVPSVPAVPLDKLCEWLAAENVTIPCHLCDHFENGKCSVENDMKVTCPSGAGAWRKVLEKGMEVET